MNREANSVLESASRTALESASRAVLDSVDGTAPEPRSHGAPESAGHADIRTEHAALHASSEDVHAEHATRADLPTTPSPSREPALVRFLYPAPAHPRTVGSIFKWWEARRPAYNLVVGTGGALTMAIATVMSQLMGQPVPVSQILAPVIPIAIMANVCYTLGPLTESLLHKLWGREVLPVGPHLFRAGLILSVGVMFVIPALLMGFGLVLWMLGFG